MKSAEDIKRYFQQATLSTNPDRHKAIFEKIQRAQDQSKATAPASSWPHYRSQVMKSPITKLAAVAAIILVFFTGLFLLKQTGSGITLADVLGRMEQVGQANPSSMKRS